MLNASPETCKIAAFPPAMLLIALCLPVRAQPPAKVSVAPVIMHEFVHAIDVVGEAEALRSGKASAEIEGSVTSVRVIEGQAVDPSTVVVTLRDTLLKIRERGAEAQLRLAREQLAEAETGSRPEDILEAKARLDEALARLKEAEDDFNRVKQLRSRDAATPEDLTVAEAKAAAARAVVAQRRAAHERIKAGPRKEVIERARAQVAIRQAALDEIRDELERTRIRAPFAGIVTRKLVEAGNFVRTGDAVLELVQIDPIRVMIPVPEAAIRRVRPGLKVTLTFDALGNQRFEGQVEAVIPQGDRLARTFPVKVLLPNPDQHILPGMTARISVPLGERSRATAVSRDALVQSGGRTLVYAVRGGMAVPVPVTTMGTDGTLVQVKGELREGEKVIVRGNERLRPGQPVIVLPNRGVEPERGGKRR